MAEKLRACLFSAAKEATAQFREAFDNLSGVEVLGVTAEWDQLRDWVRAHEPDTVGIFLDDEARTGQHVVEKLAQFAPGTTILGVSDKTDPAFIIAAMRAGCGQFVPWPIDQSDLANAIDRIRASKRTTIHSSKRICVIGSSGGVGATAIACNLAIEFGSMSDRPTALVDLNLEFGDLGCAFDCAPKYTISDICADGAEIDPHMLGAAIHVLDCNVALMVRPESMEQAREVSPEGVQRMLKVMGEMYPYVVVDLPRSFNFFSAAAVADADKIIVVTQLSVASIRNASRILQLLLQMGASDENVAVVVNRFKASYERINQEEVESHFNRPVFALIPNDYKRMQSSMDLGQPVMQDAPNSPARLAIQEMAKKIAGHDAGKAPAAPAPAAPAGLFGKLWKRTVAQGS